MVCWNRELARGDKVLDTQAENPEDRYFLATHYPITVRVDRPGSGRMREEEVLEELLSEGVGAVRCFLRGPAGSGKSHLVRWLHCEVQRRLANDATLRERLRVIRVPKSGTNLRDVIRMVLDGMTGDAFDQYRASLQQAGPARPEDGVKHFLDFIARSVPHLDRRELPARGSYQQHQKDLCRLLREDVVEEALTTPDGVVSKLYDNALGTASFDEEHAGAPLEFRAEDFPADLDETRIHHELRDFHQRLREDPDLRRDAACWVTAAIRDAQSLALNLRSEDLGRLFKSVRQELAERGRELLLLVEDFAKLQGVDRQLLDALLAANQQEGVDLCPVRFVIALTEGYWDRLDDTAQERTDFLLHLDEEAIDNMPRLATGYLAALRADDDELQQWYDEGGALPNVCAGCEERGRCHASFGHVDGVGLYPLTSLAIEKMLAARQSALQREHRTPRLLVQEVLKPLLATYAGDIEAGGFPAPGLGRLFSGAYLDPIAGPRIEAAYRDTAERVKTACRVWGDGRAASTVPALAFEWWQLGRPPEVEDETTDTGGDPPPPPPPPSQSPLPRDVARRISELTAWSNGQRMSQPLLNHLRPLVRKHIIGYIDWDIAMVSGDLRPTAERLARTCFAGAHINFRGQATEGGAGASSLVWPANPRDLGDTALALQALILYEHHEGWGFENAADHFRALARCLPLWANDVMELVTSACETEESMKRLALGALLAGKVPPAPPDDLLAQAISKWHQAPSMSDDHLAARAPAWRRVALDYCRERAACRKEALARLHCCKGEATTSTLWDASEALAHLKGLEGFVREQDARLAEAAKEEKERITGWLGRLKTLLPDPQEWGVLRDEADALVRRWHDELQGSNVNREPVDSASRDLPEGIDASKLVRAAKRAAQRGGLLEQIAAMGGCDALGMRRLEAYLGALSNWATSAAGAMERIETDQLQYADTEKHRAHALTRLDELARALGAEEAAPRPGEGEPDQGDGQPAADEPAEADHDEEPVDLLSHLRRLASALDRYAEDRNEVEAGKAWANRGEEVEDLAELARSVAASCKALRGAGVEPSWHPGDLGTRVKAYRGRLAGGRAKPDGEAEVLTELGRRLEAVKKKLKSQLRDHAYRDPSRDAIDALSNYLTSHRNQSARRQLDAALRQLEERAKDWPITKEGLQQIERAREQIVGIRDDHGPKCSPDVTKFLADAKAEGGAPLDSLTEEVREHLRHEGLTDEYRIRYVGRRVDFTESDSR